MRGIKEIQAERIAHTLNELIDEQIEIIRERYDAAVHNRIQFAKAKREAKSAYIKVGNLVERIGSIYKAYPVTSDDRNDAYKFVGIVDRVELAYSRFR